MTAHTNEVLENCTSWSLQHLVIQLLLHLDGIHVEYNQPLNFLHKAMAGQLVKESWFISCRRTLWRDKLDIFNLARLNLFK